MAFSSKEAAEKLSAPSVSKVIQPSNVTARVIDMKLEAPPYDSNALNLTLLLETTPVEDESFTGLPIDKNSPELGAYKGQVGWIQASPFAFSDYTSKIDGKTTARDEQVFRWLWNFAKEIGTSRRSADENISGDTIQEYLDEARKYFVSPDRLIHFCVGGAEYENAQGYTQHRLYLVKADKAKKPYELAVEGKEPSKVITFNPDLHIRKKKVAEKVDGFQGKDDLDI